MKRFLCVINDQYADRGYNKGISVYRIKNNQLEFVGGNYALDSKGWKGYKAEAILVVSKKLRHKTNGYSFLSKNITMDVV